MNHSEIKVVHVARRFISKELTELKTGYDLEHFKAIAKLVKQNSLIFQSKDGKKHYSKLENLEFFLAPSLYNFFFTIKNVAKKHDLIVAQNPFVAGLFSVIVGKIIKKPVIISVHGYEFTVGKIQSSMKKFVCKNATEIRANSQIVKDTIISWGIDSKKISVIEDRVDCQHFSPSINGSKIRKALKITDLMVISVASLIEIKGFDTLLIAIKKISASFGNIKFVIIGEGESRQKLEKQATDLGIDKQVSFLGNIPYEKLPQYYAAADIFVHPSYVESMGRVILEAQASGKPIIATNIGGIPEATTEQSAILIEPKKPDILAEKIIEMIKDKEARIKMGKAGRKNVEEKFEFWRQEEKLVNFYQNVYEEFKT